MSESPFKRRANLSKTYGKRTSLPPTSRTRPASTSTSEVAKLLLDSSDSEKGGKGSDSEEDVGNRLLGRKNVVGGRFPRTGTNGAKPGAAAKVKTAKGKERANTGKEDEGAATTQKRSLSTRAKSTKGDSTVWDESAALATRPTTMSRRTISTKRTSLEGGTATLSKNGTTGSPETAKVAAPTSQRRTSPRKSTQLSDTSVSTLDPLAPTRTASSSPLSSLDERDVPSDPPSPPSKRRKRVVPIKRKAEDTTEDDTIPPPFDYVPPLRRTRSSPTKPHSPSENSSKERLPSLKASATSKAAPLIRTILPSSSSPTKPATRSSPRPISPLPSNVNALKADSSSSRMVRPPSPAARDLSSLFSSFAKPEKATTSDLSGDESTASTTREGLKRATSGGIVASLAAKRAAEQGGVDRLNRAVTPVSPDRHLRNPLERSISQPLLSSPLSSPNRVAALRSPQRPVLAATSSLPDVLSPQRAVRASASPLKSGNDLFQPPAIGSMYRPVSFSATASTSSFVDNGRTRTYGGARSFRPDLDDPFAPPAPVRAPTPSTQRESTSSSLGLPSLPPSISQRLPKSTSASKESYAQLREKWGVAAEEELDEDEELESQERGARVVGTGILRAQGEGKRWSDEIGWTLDGLRDGKGGSGARSSALELLQKTLDREWMRRLKSSGMAEQVYLAFRRGGAGNGDRVLDIALVVLLAALTRDQRLSEPLFRLSSSDVDNPSQRPSSKSPTASRSSSASPQKRTDRNCEVLDTLLGIAQRDWVTEEIGGDATGKGKKGRVAKSDIRHLQSLREIIDKSSFFDQSGSKVTLRALVLQVHLNVASFVARPIFQPQHLLCTNGTFASVVDGFLEECAPLETRILKYSTGLDLLPPEDSVRSISPSTIALCLSVFEATSLATPHAFELVSSTPYLNRLCQAFCDLTLTSSILASASGPGDSADSGSKLLLSILGIIFGLSTEGVWSDALLRDRDEKDDGLIGILVRTSLKCRQVSKSRPTKAATQERKEEDEATGESRPEWDTLCLVLGILTNLVESADAAKDALREILIDPSCSSSRKCIRTCTCSSPQPVLAILSQFYLDPLEDAPNSVYRTSVAGFLRLLLGLSLVDNLRNESLILETISSPNSTNTKVSAIIDALDEFAKLHEQQDQVRGMMRIENGHEDGDSPSEPTQVEIGGEDVTMEEVGASRHNDGEDVARRIRLTIARLKRRAE
ncbi:hypothetical protein JCM16303_003891 [Sporobolomyces ruberrimus]